MTELDTTSKNQVSELMTTLKNVKQKLHEKEVRGKYTYSVSLSRRSTRYEYMQSEIRI